MDPATRAAREQVAFDKIDANAAWLGQRFHCKKEADALISASAASSFAQEPDITNLYRREALAALLEAVVAQVKREDEKPPKPTQLPAVPNGVTAARVRER